MKVIVAPNAFKGSLTASEAASAIEKGITSVIPDAEVVKVPIADGGDGIVDVLQENLNGEFIETTVTGPLGKAVNANFAYFETKKFAVIEMAKASGLALLTDDEKNPMLATTFGTGELINKALEMGVDHIYIGLGGSATNDGAIGVATALGIAFLDEKGKPVKPCGGELSRIKHIDISGMNPKVKQCQITVICDVENPLLGSNGAAQVYSPQKGATPEQVELLEAGLANFAKVVEQDLRIDIRSIPGGGAAGGMGAGLYGLFNADLKKGIDIVLELVGLDQKMTGANIAITAEGQIDEQTAYGKAPAGVAELAQKHNIPCIAIAGSYSGNLRVLNEIGITAVFTICPGPVSLEMAMKNAENYLSSTTEEIFKLKEL